MKKAARIVVVGSINMDLTVIAPRIPVEGETIIGRDFSTMPGGKGANQAVAASRLGAEVHLVGCIGDDTFGSGLTAYFDKENIHTDHLTILPGSKTGVAVITVSESGENCIVVSPGANHLVTPTHVRLAEEVIQTADIMLVQLEIPMDTVEEAVGLAKKHQVPVILNPAPASMLSEALLQQIDYLTPNETEGKLIATGQAKSDDDVETIIHHLLNRGVGHVVVTLGGAGVAYYEHDQIKLQAAHQVKVVDTTGAGDSFNAGIAVSLAEGKSLTEAVSFAQKVAALSVTQFGAQPSMPSRVQVDHFLNNPNSGGIYS